MHPSTYLTRQRFLWFSGTALGSLFMPRSVAAQTVQPRGALRQAQPHKAMVLWYSQTGHTEGYAELIARTWAHAGLTVDTHRLRFGDKPDVSGYDLIVIGTPVHYLDVPKNVGDWLTQLAPITGVGVASFVSYGGQGDGQHNAALSLLSGLVEKGGVPLGMDYFGNMSTYPPTWSMGNTERILKYRHKPDQATYAQVHTFASSVLDQYGRGQGIVAKSRPSFMGLFKGDISRTLAKATLGKHTIDTSRCIHCGTCVKTCPAGAIDLGVPRIDTARCILCFGCVNNCPTGAHSMSVFGRPVYGFPEFLRRNGIKILPPPLDQI